MSSKAFDILVLFFVGMEVMPRKISFVEFNQDGILIKEDELLIRGSFYNLLDSFSDEGHFPPLLNALFLLKLILSTDQWLYNDYKRLQDLKKIKGLEDQMNSLLKLDIGFQESDESEGHQSDFVQRIFRILFSMTQVISFKIKKYFRNNSSSGLSSDEVNKVIGLTNMVKSAFSVGSGNQDFVWKMEELKIGQLIQDQIRGKGRLLVFTAISTAAEDGFIYFIGRGGTSEQ